MSRARLSSSLSLRAERRASVVNLHFLALVLAAASFIAGAAFGEPTKLVEKAPDPHGTPRSFRNAQNVPLRTSIYFELALSDATAGEAIAQSLTVKLQPDQGETLNLLGPAEHFASGASGWVRQSGKSILVYIEPGRQLVPATRYTVDVSTGAPSAAKHSSIASWSFTTEAAPSIHKIDYSLNLKSEPLQWHGQFFSGICNVIFCTRAANYGPTYDLMNEARKLHPRAWSLQRDFWLTGMEDRPPKGFFPSNLPNIVRERETRRIAAMEPVAQGLRLRVEDFFGHEQYGIPAGRPVADDYHAGDEVLIADGIHDARTKVVAADSVAGTVTVAAVAAPADGWKIAYDGPLPTREDPDAPGLFPPGGCYLRKFNPHGTACYYWGRLDKEWDLAHRDGRRLFPNFADAPGDLSRDGRSWTTAKDDAQLHEVVQAIAGHIIDRYGKDSLNFTWSIFNEPDLSGIFWRASWDELQTYYDYTSDAILRAFEDRGYDSSKAFVGGLELGAIFGTNLRLSEFLAHCSPNAQATGALPLNAAVADHRLDGKRSRRVEALCNAHNGKGSPCDFVSIHSYNRAELMAAKLSRAKEIALEIDPDFYKGLSVNSHESCPDWMPPQDEAAGDSYLGDGYFASWCADVIHRQLLRGATDPRFAFGETIVTVWPPPDNFATLNAVTRNVHYRDPGDNADRIATIPMPIFHFLGLLSDMSNGYWPLPEQKMGGHIIGGFASRDAKGAIRVLLYAHNAQDTQSRSDASFDIALDLGPLGWPGPASVSENRFDRDHNSPYSEIKKLVGTPRTATPSLIATPYTKAQIEQVQQACKLQPTITSHPQDPDGHLHLAVPLQGNGCNFLIIQPAAADR